MNRRNLCKALIAAAVIAAVPAMIRKQAHADAERDHLVRLNALQEEMRKHPHNSREFQRLRRAYQEEWAKGPDPKPPWERGAKLSDHLTAPGHVDSAGRPIKMPWIDVNPIMRGGAK